MFNSPADFFTALTLFGAFIAFVVAHWKALAIITALPLILLALMPSSS